MSNPFSAKFDSKCQSCGDDMYEGETDVYVVNDLFVCAGCAEEEGCVCDCGNFKKPEYENCYECFESQ